MTNSFYEIAEEAYRLEASGRDIIRLNVGNTGLPAPEVAVKAATESLEHLKSGYVSSAGSPKLLAEIAKRESCDADEVAIGVGSKQLLYALFSILAAEKKSIATPAPYWPAYPLIAKQLKLAFKPLELNSDNWQLLNTYDLSTVSSIIICNPLNPTSTIFDSKGLNHFVEQATAAGIPVILDEAYRDIAFTPIETVPNTIRIRSFSKEFNMEGWRLGYVVAPPKLIKEVIRFNQISITCVPPFVQEAGVACLQDCKRITTMHKEIWTQRLAYFGDCLSEIGFEFTPAQSGMYLFASHPQITDADAFAKKLLGYGVAVAPGSAFGDFKRHFRFSASEDMPRLKEACDRIKKCLSEAYGSN